MEEFDLNLPEGLSPPPKGVFTPHATYSRVGDMLSIYWDEERSYAVRLSPVLTILRAFSDGRVTGVKVMDVKEMVDKGS